MPIEPKAMTAGSGSDCQVMYSPEAFQSSNAAAIAPKRPGAPTFRAIAMKATAVTASATSRPQRASPTSRPPAASTADSGQYG
jgi:hypothetical protein